MVLQMKRCPTRDILLVLVALVWGTLLVLGGVNGRWPSEADWGVLAATLGAIMLLFRGDSSGRDQGGGQA